MIFQCVVPDHRGLIIDLSVCAALTRARFWLRAGRWSSTWRFNPRSSHSAEIQHSNTRSKAILIFTKQHEVYKIPYPQEGGGVRIILVYTYNYIGIRIKKGRKEMMKKFKLNGTFTWLKASLCTQCITSMISICIHMEYNKRTFKFQKWMITYKWK